MNQRLEGSTQPTTADVEVDDIDSAGPYQARVTFAASTAGFDKSACSSFQATLSWETEDGEPLGRTNEIVEGWTYSDSNEDGAEFTRRFACRLTNGDIAYLSDVEVRNPVPCIGYKDEDVASQRKRVPQGGTIRRFRPDSFFHGKLLSISSSVQHGLLADKDDKQSSDLEKLSEKLNKQTEKASDEQKTAKLQRQIIAELRQINKSIVALIKAIESLPIEIAQVVDEGFESFVLNQVQSKLTAVLVLLPELKEGEKLPNPLLRKV